MNHTWTLEDHELVKFLTTQGWTVDEISADTGYSVGSIKRSRGLQRNRISSDKVVEPISADKAVERISAELSAAKADILELQREVLRISAELSAANADIRAPKPGVRAVKSFGSMIHSRSTLNQREVHIP